MKRYALVRANGASAMLVDEYGSWVRFEDVADVQARLNAAIEALEAIVKNHDKWDRVDLDCWMKSARVAIMKAKGK